MGYAVMQHVLEDIAAEPLVRAFRSVPSLTDQDAGLQAKDAYGILAKGLSQVDAAALQRALRAEGIESHVVDEAELPALPMAKALKRAEPLAQALVIYDALGRPQQVDWSQVILVAAGNVNLRQFKREYTSKLVARGQGVVLETDLEVQELRKLNLLAEVFLAVEPRRCRVVAKSVGYAYLGARRSNRSADNFVMFVQDLVRQAASADINRGAEMLAGDPPTAMTYPSRYAFEEEIIWYLWARQNAGG